MESVWETAPASAVKVWRRGADFATSPNRAAVRWLERQPWREVWPQALSAIVARCDGSTGEHEGRLEAGLLPVPIDWVCVPVEEGWLLWLSEPMLPRPDDASAQQSLTVLRQALEMAGVGYWRRSDDTTPMEWNSQMFTLHGRDPARGVPTYDDWLGGYVHPEDREPISQRLALARQRPAEAFRFEFRIRRDDGAWRWIESRSCGEGQHGRIGVHIDQTERHAAQAELQLAREQSHLATDAAGIGVWVRELVGGESYWNEQMYRLRGLDPADPRPVMALAGLTQSAEERQSLEAMLVRHVEQGEPYEAQTRVRWPDGSEHWLATRGRVSRDEAGRPQRVCGVNWDITQQRLAEQALRDKHTAEQASRAKSEFLARLSHELRTPLNAVLGFTQLMTGDPSEPPSMRQQLRLSQIDSAARHLLDLIDDVLDLTGDEVDAVPFAGSQVLLAEVVQEALRDVETLLREQAIDLVVQAPPDQVWADRRRLRQALGHLLANAIQYNRPGGTVEVIGLRAEHEGGPMIGLQVRDSGPGLTPEQQAQLFQPFNRLGAESRGIEGSGLGLSIARHLVRCMAGRITVESEAGSGSSFCIWLPAAAAEPCAVPEAPPCGLRVLCIEDNPVNMMLVRELFALRPAMRLLTADTGAEGIAGALASPPDLVLLDMQLPDMDGMHVFHTLREAPQLAQTRFIALSANVMAEDVDAALAAGFADYWTKPIDFARFLRDIDAIPLMG